MSMMWPHENDLLDFWIKDNEQLGSDQLNRAPKEIYERLVKQSQAGFIASCLVPAMLSDRSLLQPTVVDETLPTNDKVQTKTLNALDIIVVGNKVFFGSDISSYEVTWGSGEVPPTDIDWYVYYSTDGILSKIRVSDDTGYPDSNKLYIARVTMNAGEITHCFDMRGFKFHQHDSQRVRFTPGTIRCYGVVTGKQDMGDDSYWISMSGARWSTSEWDSQRFWVWEGAFSGMNYPIIETRPYIAGVQDAAVRIVAPDDPPNIGDTFVVTDTRIEGDSVHDALLHHGHQGGSDGERIQTAGLVDSAVTTPKIQNGAVTDAKLGSRTIDQALAGGALLGTLTQLLGWLATAVKNIKGTTNFWDAAAASIATIWSKFNATTGHKHTGGADDAPQISGTTGIQDGTITEAKLAFDVATQVELNTHKTLDPIDHPSGSVRTTHILDSNVTVSKLDNHAGASDNKVFVPQTLVDNAHVVTDALTTYPYGQSRFITTNAVVHGFPYTWSVVVTVRHGGGVVNNAMADHQICWPWVGGGDTPDPLTCKMVPMIRYQQNGSPAGWGPWTEYHEGRETVRTSKLSQQQINMSVNGSFEDVDSIFLDGAGNAQPDGWQVAFFPGGSGNIVTSPPAILGSAHGGQRSYVFHKDTTLTTEGGGMMVGNFIPVATGDVLIFDVWVRCDWGVGKTRNLAGFVQYQADKSTVAAWTYLFDEERTSSHSWKKVKMRLQITDVNVRFVQPILIGGYYEAGVYGNAGQADTFFDDVVIRKKLTIDVRSATIVVAAYNSSDDCKQSADYVCTGTGDQTTIQAAIAATGGYGEVFLCEGTYNFNNIMNAPLVSANIRGCGDGTNIVGGGFGFVTYINCKVEHIRFTQTILMIGSGCVVSNCTFETNSQIQTCGGGAQYNIRIVNNRFYACATAMFLDGFNHLLVADNVMHDCNVGIIISGALHDTSNYLSILNNLILFPTSGGYMGIEVRPVVGYAECPDRVHIVGNSIAGYTYGIYITAPGKGTAAMSVFSNMLYGNTNPLVILNSTPPCVFAYAHNPPNAAHTSP